MLLECHGNISNNMGEYVGKSSINIHQYTSINKTGALSHNFRTVAMFLGSSESLWLGKSWYLIGIS